MTPSAVAVRLTEEVIVRGLIDTLRAHRYELTRDERREVRDLLNFYVNPDVVTNLHVAFGYLNDPDELGPGPDLNAAADYLFAYLCATNLITIGEALQVVMSGRVDNNDSDR